MAPSSTAASGTCRTISAAPITAATTNPRTTSARRAQGKEGNQPERAVEKARGNRHAAEQRRIAEPPDRKGRANPDQRGVQVRNHRRPGDGETLGGRTPGYRRQGPGLRDLSSAR